MSSITILAAVSAAIVSVVSPKASCIGFVI